MGIVIVAAVWGLALFVLWSLSKYEACLWQADLDTFRKRCREHREARDRDFDNRDKQRFREDGVK